MQDKIKYVEHPVTKEHKRELRQQGYKIVDARFAPKDAQVEKSRAKQPRKTAPKSAAKTAPKAE